MNNDERRDAEPTGEEVPERSPLEVAEKAGDHEFPVTGPGGDMTSDDESLARRPDLDEEKIDGDTEKGGTPPGTAIRGS